MEGSIIDKNKYILPQVVRCYDVDSRMRMRPSAFMDYAQEMAYQAAEAMGFGYEAMIKGGKAWVLSRLNFVFDRAPLWGEKVLLQTWHKGPSGPFYVRDFRVTDESGAKELIRGTSSWVIMDVEKRTMVRTSDLVALVDPASHRAEDAIVQNAQRLMLPKGAELTLAGTHTVGYSDIDIQQHTNNARYVLWAMNCIDCDLLGDHPFKELTINFNHETKAGDVVELWTLRDGLSFWIEGKNNGNQVFCVKVNLYE